MIATLFLILLVRAGVRVGHRTLSSQMPCVRFKLLVLRMSSGAPGDHQYVAAGVSLSSTQRASSPSDPSRASLQVNPDDPLLFLILLALLVFFSHFS